MSNWTHANLPGQDARFRKLEEGHNEMKLNFDAINASIVKLQVAVASANKRISDLEAEIAGGQADQAPLDAAAAAVSAEADKLSIVDVGGSTGGITA